MSPGPGEPERGAAHVALVEDHQLLNAALASGLRAEGFVVTLPALTTIKEIIDELLARPPQVALVDLDLRRVGSGEELVGPLAGAGCAVIIVSGTTDETQVGRCLDEGAVGWVPKAASFDELLGAVLAAIEGRAVMAAGERQRLLEAWRERRQADSVALAPFERLTGREAAVLGLLMDGRAVERIAALSYVSEATVRSQVRAILRKLEVNSQLEAVAMAARSGWRPADA